MYICDAIGNTTNDKGNFAEYILYDFYSGQNFYPYLLRRDKSGAQRIGENKDIVMPDLVVRDTNNDLFFVESKSSYIKSKNDEGLFMVSKELEKTYQNFYKKIYPSKNINYENTIPTLLVFSKIWHNNIDEGIITSYFMRLVDIVQLDEYMQSDNSEFKRFTEESIYRNSFDIQTFKLKAKSYNKILSFEYNDDIMNTDRNLWLAPDAKSLMFDIQNVI